MLNEFEGLYSDILEKLQQKFGDIKVLNIDLGNKTNIEFDDKYTLISIENPEFAVYEELADYINDLFNALIDGGVLLIHALNPENIRVSTEYFYEIPMRKRLLPPKLSQTLLKDTGFKRSAIIRDEINEYIDTKKYFDISDVTDSVSRGYTIIAQKDSDDISFLDDFFALKRGISLDEALSRFERRELNDKKHIDILKDKISTFEEDIELYANKSKDIDTLKKENKEFKNMLLSIEKENTLLKDEITDLHTKLDNLWNDNIELHTVIDNLSHNHHNLSHAFEHLRRHIEVTDNSCFAIKQCIKRVGYKIKRLFKKNSVDNTTCTTQILNEKNIEDIEKRIDNIESKEYISRPSVRNKPVFKSSKKR